MPTLQGFPMAFPGGTSQYWTTPYPIALGQRARDTAGNEFIFVDVVTGVYPGCVVSLNDETWRATALGVAGAVAAGTKVGVVMPPLDTSAPTDGRGIWVQVYGRVLMQVGGSVVSPSDAANGPTTNSSELATVFQLPTSQTTPSGVPFPASGVSHSSDVVDYVLRGIRVATGASPADVSGHAGQGGVVARESTPAVTAVTSAGSYIGSSIYVFLNYPEIEARPGNHLGYAT